MIHAILWSMSATKITMAPHSPTAEQAKRMLDRGTGITNVLVNGVIVGQVAKNKHNIWIGHFDADAINESNPFVAARLTHKVHPAGRTFGTGKKDIVRSVAAQNVGEYVATIHANARKRAEAQAAKNLANFVNNFGV